MTIGKGDKVTTYIGEIGYIREKRGENETWLRKE